MRDKKRNYLKYLFLFFFSLIFLSGIGMIYLDFIYNKMNKEKMTIFDDSLEDDDTNLGASTLNILMLGVDELESEYRGRTDAMMIASINNKTETISLISLMRDLWIPIPGHGEGKLNWVYPKGDIKLLLDVIYRQFGVKIDGYVIMDFNKFAYVIDQLGGVRLSLTKDEVKFINRENRGSKQLVGSGEMHLDGKQALHFARDRDDPTADFKRTERQRVLVSAMINQIAHNLVDNNGGILNLISIAKNIVGSLKTSFSLSDAILLAKLSKKITKYNILMYRIPESYQSSMKNGHSVLTSDLRECKKLLRKYIYGEDNLYNGYKN